MSRRPVVAITQARIGSSRLPGKVLLDLCGKPLLWWHLTRLQRAARLDRIMVATTDEPEAAAIVEIARDLGIDSFRGSQHDVLGRFLGAADKAEAKTIVRVTSDCPLIDPAVIDQLVATYEAEPGCRYASLDVGRYPRGLDCEIVDYAALQEATAQSSDDADREHVTPYVRRHGDRFGALFLAPDDEVKQERWCVDTPGDFALVEKVLERLGHRPGFGWREVVALLDAHPVWRGLNADIQQKTHG